nr:histidinol dehydrogenase [uncultured Sphaerochaeta sp.]
MAFLQRYENPPDEQLNTLLTRNLDTTQSVTKQVSSILEAVKEEGDTALFRFASEFDGVTLTSLSVSKIEKNTAVAEVDDTLKRALRQAYDNIHSFHAAQMPTGEQVEVSSGISLSRKVVPLNRVGLYIPGGTAPLFSTVLMLAIPALVAGCPEVVLCTPPGKQGTIHPAILYAAELCNVKEIYAVGGAQAIAAMAYGTQSIKSVDKIFGPGNQYVTEAKVQVSSTTCAIDMPAGPSEVMVVASPSSNPAFVASDLLSQAEHGRDSQAMLVVQGEKREGNAFIDRVEVAIAKQLTELQRTTFLEQSLAGSRAFIVDDLAASAHIVNAYAPEHLIIDLGEAEDDALLEKVVNAGSVFLGPYSCESAGDYASGTNHTLPTNGWARSYSGVSTDSFIKKITVQKISKEGLAFLAPTLLCMAEKEQLGAHRNAVAVRLGGDR